MLLFLLVTLLFLPDPVTSEWTDEAHFFTIHQLAKTWNEARTICHNAGGQLLTVHNESAWTMWKYLLDSDMNSNMRSSSVYWFGLHALEASKPSVPYYWDSCDVSEYLDPAMDDFIVTEEQCVYIWINREVFVGVFQNMWVKGRMCNETRAFICMKGDDDGACVPSCDEMVVPTTENICTILCANNTCTARYIHELQKCHFWPSVYSDDDSFTVCYLPSLEYLPKMCGVTLDVTDYSITDTNINVTDTSCKPDDTSVTVDTTASVVTSSVSIEESQTSTKAVPQSTTSPSKTDTCLCSCEKLWTFLATPQPEVINLTTEEKVDLIVQELTVDRKNVSSSTRRHISVMDYRASSVGIGAIAGGLIFSVIAIIVIIDLSRIWHEIRYILYKLVMFLKGLVMPHRYPVATLAKASSTFPVSFAKGRPKAKAKHRKKSRSKNIHSLKGATYLDILIRSNSVDDAKAPVDTLLETKLDHVNKRNRACLDVPQIDHLNKWQNTDLVVAQLDHVNKAEKTVIELAKLEHEHQGENTGLEVSQMIDHVNKGEKSSI